MTNKAWTARRLGSLLMDLRRYRREVISGESPSIDGVLTQMQALVRETVTTEKRERAVEILQIVGGK